MQIRTGKCPKCDKVMSKIAIQAVKGQVLLGATLNALSYQCPHCHTVLSVEVDPIALKSEIVDELFKRMRGGK